MQLFLFENATQVSNPDHAYHSGGSVMVLAKGISEVTEMLAESSDVILDDDDWSLVRVFDVSDMELPEVFIFPDAGCC